MTSDPDIARARTISRLVGLWIPLAITAVGTVLMVLWLPALPETVAIHWNAAGDADGFGPAWSLPLLAAATGVGIALLLGLLPTLASREGEWGPTLRFLGALSLGTTAFLVITITWSAAMQRGLDDAHDAPTVLLPLAAAAVAGAAAGIVGWFVQPAVAVSGGGAPAGIAPETMSLAAGERVAWLRTTTMARGAVIVIVAAAVVLAVAAIATALTGFSLWWIFALAAALLVVLLGTTGIFRVRVSDEGLRVTSPFGVPRFAIPLADVESATVVDVQPLAQFGGYGLRLGMDGRFGVVLHRGEGIQVVRRSGRTFVVTVDDAATGTALLRALAARAAA